MKNLRWKGNRFFLGLTGMPGSGKSTARNILEKLGCMTLDADALAHEVLDQSETQERLQGLFGKDVIQEGKANRGAIAEKVFGNQELLNQLNALIHPRVRLLARERMNEFPEGSIVVYDVPLLFEAGLEQEMDATLVIDAGFAARLHRVRSRDWDEAQLQARDQHHFQDKAERADFVIRNESSRKHLEDELKTVMKEIEAARQ